MSRYTRQHYEDIARWLKESRAWALQLDSSHARAVMASTIGTFADEFAADNPLFDRDRFLAACGLEREPAERLVIHDGSFRDCTSHDCVADKEAD